MCGCFEGLEGFLSTLLLYVGDPSNLECLQDTAEVVPAEDALEGCRPSRAT